MFPLKQKKTVKARQLGPVCKNTQWCKKGGRECAKLTDEQRQDIFTDYYKLDDVHLQREFILQYVRQISKKSTTTTKIESRRQKTNIFYLPMKGSTVKICQKLFLNTLGITEKIMRTALEKLQDTGVILKDRRGGRCKAAVEIDQANRKLIENHINRFPRVESHYCRSNTSREYLHSDLTIKKMYAMFTEELGSSASKPCLTTYRSVFNSMNLSFLRPKKDMCGLCKTYFDGSPETKLRLKATYEEHTKTKNAIREIKKSCKTAAENDPKVVCCCFDLQQVIYLPMSSDGAVFYKRRFAVYNLTFYDVATRECYCFTWNECDSGRGASEISTALLKILKIYDKKQPQYIYLFADGCGGQNKNSIVAGALMYILSTLK